MSAIVEVDCPCPSATDGEIAAINLESARCRAWARFAQDQQLPGVAEAIVDLERLAAQFLGDLDALDRLDALAAQFARVDGSSRAALVQAEVASTVHRFDDARDHLARAARMGGPCEAIDHAKRFYRYSKVAGFPATHYSGMLEVRPKGSGSVVEWRVQYLADSKPDIAVRTRVSTLIKTGLGSLAPRFAGVA